MEFEAVNVLVYLYMKKAFTRGSASHLKFSKRLQNFNVLKGPQKQFVID